MDNVTQHSMIKLHNTLQMVNLWKKNIKNLEEEESSRDGLIVLQGNSEVAYVSYDVCSSIASENDQIFGISE